MMQGETLAGFVVSKCVGNLLHGAIDLHVHCYPDLGFGVRRAAEDWTTAESARNMGMRGLVLKSHLWPTTNTAYHLRHAISGIDIYGSITMNISAGGISPWAAEAAIQQGAKAIFLPTWSAKNDWNSGGFSQLMKEWFPSLNALGIKDLLVILDNSGRLLPEVTAILNMAKEHCVMLATGHLSISETLVLAREAHRIGFTQLLVAHPLAHHIAADSSQLKELASLGAYIEFSALSCFWPGTPYTALEKTVEAIHTLGPEQCVLTTDSFFEWPPVSSEFLRMFIARLLLLGIEEESIARMVRQNPAKLLGLCPECCRPDDCA